MPSQQLILNSNSSTNPQTIDLTPYLDVQDGKGMDVADPAFSNRIWSRSLLKEGATLSMEQLTEKELTFPVHLGPVGGAANAPATLSATLQFIAQIQSALETPGATVSWQPLGASQPTVFDVLSGIFEVGYSYWQENQQWTSGNLRIFTQPLGRVLAPRQYASASGIGPLLMISPYASSSVLQIGASTQAGTAGFGGKPAGASTGVFYWGAPSLAGDAPSLLQIRYQAPVAPKASNVGVMPFVAVSLLPDSSYRPLVTSAQIALSTGFSLVPEATAVASTFTRTNFNYGARASAGFGNQYQWSPNGGQLVGPEYAGSHRVLGIARASIQPQALTLYADAAVPVTTTATVYPGDWQVCDLGTLTLRGSQSYQPQISVLAWSSPFAASTSVCADLTALVVLPDNRTWFFNPQSLNVASQTIQSLSFLNQRQILVEQVGGEQFLYAHEILPAQSVNYPDTFSHPRITPYSRGLVPNPDPNNGLPVIAILGVGQMSMPATGQNASAAWPNPQNLSAYAQVNVLERARYVLP